MSTLWGAFTIKKNAAKFDSDGFEILDNFISPMEVELLKDAVGKSKLDAAKGGIRNAEKLFPDINSLATSDKMIAAAQNYLKGSPNFVRAILFDKTPDNNWLVSWHQDKTIAISEITEIDGWGPWTIKDGINHVQPPLVVLNDTITFRLHLDDTTKENGCLRVLPGSHQLGILAASDVANYAATQVPVDCEAKAGSALVMRPHLIHASSKAKKLENRRVIHIEYSGYQLTNGLNWV